MALYDGVNGVARKVTKFYDGVNGVARKVTKAYSGVNGVARKYWSGVTAGELAVGDSVWFNVHVSFDKYDEEEDEVVEVVWERLAEFIVVHQGNPDSAIYDESCNGTWLLMKDILGMAAFNDDESNYYPGSFLHTNIMAPLFDGCESHVKAAIKTAKIPYGTRGSGPVTGANGLSTQFFILSRYEVGFESSEHYDQDGTCLDYFSGNDTRIAYRYGVAEYWWLRSGQNKGGAYISAVTDTGRDNAFLSDESLGVRPACILDSKTAIDQSTGKNIIA